MNDQEVDKDAPGSGSTPPVPKEPSKRSKTDPRRLPLITKPVKNGLIGIVEETQRRIDIPDFSPGDTVKVNVKVTENNRERVQLFHGYVIGRQGSGIRETFTVRKLSFGVGVERTFPVHSPMLESIEVTAKGDVRRAKLYYLRDSVGKAAKIKEKRRL